MVPIIPTDEFSEWFQPLDKAIAERVVFYVKLLEQKGVSLEYPYCSDIEGSRYAIRELRVQALGRPLRVFYTFDPQRRAVLLIGGEKTGQEKRFYRTYTPLAERIWEKYLSQLASAEKQGQEVQPKGKKGRKEG